MPGTRSKTADPGNSADAALLSLRGVRKEFGHVVAVDGIDLDVAEGAFVTLLGPSGCGKTTTLNLVAGFESPDAGDVLLAGKRINGLPPHRRPLNTVFQGYALFPHLNVEQNVGFGLRMQRTGRDETRRRVAETLETVHMGQMARRSVDQLSGGQQQRVALARALVNKPQLVLLDEPLSALDAQLRKAMQVELKRIQESVGITFVYVTHDQEEALVMSDLVCVMNEGRIEQLGPPQELYENPRSIFVAKFIGRNNFLPARIADAGVVFPGGVTVAFADPLKAGAAVVAVRPEHLALWSDPGPQRLPGTVRALRFLGDRIEAEVELEGGTTITAYANGTPVEPAGSVFVELPTSEHFRVLEAAEA
jgi:spermidine/putrescine transport system ATP-binding protein